MRRKQADIRDMFRCESLSGMLSYMTCISRQGAVKESTLRHPFCAQCERGGEVKAMFPTFKPAPSRRPKIIRERGLKSGPRGARKEPAAKQASIFMKSGKKPAKAVEKRKPGRPKKNRITLDREEAKAARALSVLDMIRRGEPLEAVKAAMAGLIMGGGK